jgi:Arc/MetJ-type ribon-helix-helix transcriptional regulator
MPVETTTLASEIESFSAPLIASGKFSTASEVVHAAMDALRQRLADEAYDLACIKAAEEGEASGLFEGDPFERIREKYGWKRPEE